MSDMSVHVAASQTGGLREPAFAPLPLGAIKPTGWLRRQLVIQRNGLSGHLDEIWPDVADSGWIGGAAEGWERGPYWLDGIVPLAYLLEDAALIGKVERWMSYILDHAADGWLGPVQERAGRQGPYDTWPVTIALKAICQYHEATGDRRAVDAVSSFFAVLPSILDDHPLSSWAQFRWQDLMLSAQWLNDRSDDASERVRLGVVMDRLHDQGFDWVGHFMEFPFTDRLEAGRTEMRSHVVNNAMAVKAAAVWFRCTGRRADRLASDRAIEVLQRFHGQATRLFTGDEHLAGLNPSQGTELCAVVELLFSLSTVLSILGDATTGDMLECIAFNALPAAFTRDMWAHQYDQQANQVVCRVSEDRVYTTNGPDANIFGLEPNYGCCTANMHQGWPKFVSHLWMATPDGGLALMIAAPCVVSTLVPQDQGDAVRVRAEVHGDYPFDEELVVSLHPDRPVQFPLVVRIPGWAEGAVVDAVGSVVPDVVPGRFVCIERTWSRGDQVRLHLPMPVRAERRPLSTVSLYRGPLVLSLAVDEEWRLLRGDPPVQDWEVYPASPWNYALMDDQRGIDARARKSHVADVPFSRESPPVHGRVAAVRVPDWVVERNAAAPPPAYPNTQGTVEQIELVPYGCTALRITEFPVVRSEVPIAQAGLSAGGS